jgi:nucleoside-diphosphate-sugar epimerase
MRILISGGAGYIGSMLTIGLLSEGHHVTVLDHFSHRQNSLAVCCANENFTAVRGDVRNMGMIKALLAHADVVIPLAAVVGAPACDADPTAAITINREAIKMLCQFASKEQRIVIPITNSGYGVGEQGIECTEDSPLRPISLYGQTKVEAEAVALQRENSISLRLATVFGMSPRMRTDLLCNDFVYRAVYDRAILLFEARFKRNFIHVRDVARAFIHALDNFEAMKGQAYNVGLSDANLSKWELCEHIKVRVPWFYFCEAPIGEDVDKRDYIVSNAKLEGTGFKPAFSLDAGIVELIKGYKTIRNGTYGNV